MKLSCQTLRARREKEEEEEEEEDQSNDHHVMPTEETTRPEKRMPAGPASRPAEPSRVFRGEEDTPLKLHTACELAVSRGPRPARIQ